MVFEETEKKAYPMRFINILSFLAYDIIKLFRTKQTIFNAMLLTWIGCHSRSFVDVSLKNSLKTKWWKFRKYIYAFLSMAHMLWLYRLTIDFLWKFGTFLQRNCDHVLAETYWNRNICFEGHLYLYFYMVKFKSNDIDRIKIK